MKGYIYIGKVIKPHGIKGEIRILSDFEDKKDAFKIGQTLYFGQRKEPNKVLTHRLHKGFDMITLENKENINEILYLINFPVYLKREDLNKETIFNEELIGFTVKEQEEILGKITDYYYNKNQVLLVVEKENTKFYIPKVPEYILTISKEEKCIKTKNAKGLIIK